MLLGDIKQHLQSITECPDWSIGCIHSDQPKSIAVLGKQGLLQAVQSYEQSYASKTIELVIRWNDEAEAEQTAQQLYDFFLAQPNTIGTWKIVQCSLPYDTPVNMQPLPDNGIEYRIEVMITYRKGE